MQKKLSSLELLIHDLQQKIQSVHNELLQMAYANQTFSAAFYHKDAEMKHLKAQLHSLQAKNQAQKKAQSMNFFDMFASSSKQTTFSHVPPISQTLFSSPSQFSMFGSFETSPSSFGTPSIMEPTSPFFPPPKRPAPPRSNFPKPQTKPQNPLETPQPSNPRPSPTIVNNKKSSDQLMIKNSAPKPSSSKKPISSLHHTMVSTFETNVSLHEPLSGYSSETESDSSMDFLQVYMMSPEEEADVEHPPIVEEAEPEVPFQTPTFNPSTYTNISSQGFSFDGVPPSKWLDKLYEIHAWCKSSLLAPNATVTEVITKCTAKFLGHLHQWYISWCISTNAALTRSQYRHIHRYATY